ncbi:MAG: hypothetical protein J3Q66DRAFT_355595 [Benniella sp.]|nr:MAG: hypothetical protein J3Q66DRAFT_355595 [Benniella sp.]
MIALSTVVMTIVRKLSPMYALAHLVSSTLFVAAISQSHARQIQMPSITVPTVLSHFPRSLSSALLAPSATEDKTVVMPLVASLHAAAQATVLHARSNTLDTATWFLIVSTNAVQVEHLNSSRAATKAKSVSLLRTDPFAPMMTASAPMMEQSAVLSSPCPAIYLLALCTTARRESPQYS